jgi:TPR repeat protein
MLQYHHRSPEESPINKYSPDRASQTTINSAGSSPSSGGLRVLRTSGPRVSSHYSLGSGLRSSTYSPLSADESVSNSGSPRSYARKHAGNRRSPDTRPMSYIDLLNDLPYSQQVAPAPTMKNTILQSAVGNHASLLDNKKTLDMYRANVKKTNDPSIQYEFAIFMINAARDHTEDTESNEIIKESRGILQRLSDRAYPFAQYYLADGYFSGLFNKDKPDYDKSLPLFVAASKHGHAESGYRAALCYEFGWGCARNYPKAVQFFRAAASKGHPGAAIRLGKACLTGDMGLVNRYREGVKWLKRATDSADHQYNSGPYELGLLHITGFGEDIFKDEAYAAQLMTKSAELGHAEANYRMGQAYENGTFGCPKDAALSVHFYNGAASKGLPDAMMALCAWYMVGAEPVLEKDEVEAYEWARKAGEYGKDYGFSVLE